MDYTLRTPLTNKEWQDYYLFRWQQLREPWQQPPGSEKDEYEDTAHHVFAIDAANTVLAVGRLHIIDQKYGQIRYMAVTKNRQDQGIGLAILNWLEKTARELGLRYIFLHARENAVGFYLQHGYIQTETSHTLFDEIRHVKMEKTLPS